MRKGSMMAVTLTMIAAMGPIPALGDTHSSPMAPDLEDLKLPDTSDVARRTCELEERQTPSRKKRLRLKGRQR